MLQTLVGVLIVVVLSNGMVLMGVPPSVQTAVQGLMIIAAVALSIDRRKHAGRQMSAALPSWRSTASKRAFPACMR